VNGAFSCVGQVLPSMEICNGLDDDCNGTTDDAPNLCSGSTMCCGIDGCIDPATSVKDCGGCGMACTVAHGTPLCRLRACAIATCDQGWADCDGSYANGCETALPPGQTC
jgi:hypothetical protein